LKSDACCIFVTYNDIPFGDLSGFMFSTDQSATNLHLKPNKQQELLSDWAICIIFLHMIGW